MATTSGNSRVLTLNIYRRSERLLTVAKYSFVIFTYLLHPISIADDIPARVMCKSDSVLLWSTESVWKKCVFFFFFTSTLVYFGVFVQWKVVCVLVTTIGTCIRETYEWTIFNGRNVPDFKIEIPTSNSMKKLLS